VARGEERKIAPHPSLKPQAFMRQLVRAALPLGRGVILDPFMGAGSTVAAAKMRAKIADIWTGVLSRVHDPSIRSRRVGPEE